MPSSSADDMPAASSPAAGAAAAPGGSRAALVRPTHYTERQWSRLPPDLQVRSSAAWVDHLRELEMQRSGGLAVEAPLPAGQPPVVLRASGTAGRPRVAADVPGLQGSDDPKRLGITAGAETLHAESAPCESPSLPPLPSPPIAAATGTQTSAVQRVTQDPHAQPPAADRVHSAALNGAAPMSNANDPPTAEAATAPEQSQAIAALVHPDMFAEQHWNTLPLATRATMSAQWIRVQELETEAAGNGTAAQPAPEGLQSLPA